MPENAQWLGQVIRTILRFAKTCWKYRNGKLHPKGSNRDKERREVYMDQIRTMYETELEMQQQDRHIFKKSLEQWEQSSMLA
eukprot:1427256-Ditylum_brightwellii.AAC.1